MLCRKLGYDLTYILNMFSDLDTMAVEYLDERYHRRKVHSASAETLLDTLSVLRIGGSRLRFI